MSREQYEAEFTGNIALVDPDQSDIAEVKRFEDILDDSVTQASHSQDAKCWEIAYYQPHFSVSTATVLQRMLHSVVPRSGRFFENSPPDLYGPFWIATTLICLVLFTSHFVLRIEGDADGGFDLTKICSVAALVYGCITVIPLLCFCVLNNAGSGVSLAEILSMYGYSYSALLAACLLAIIPNGLIRWAAFGLLGAWSVFIYMKNIWGEMVSTDKKYILVGLGSIGQVAVILSANLYFYG